MLQLHTPHIIVSTAGVQLNANVVTVNFFKCLESFETETSTILDAATPLICTFVGSAVKELRDEIAVGTMDYHDNKHHSDALV